MGYLIQNDYLKQIQASMITQLGGVSVLNQVELSAEGELRSYLVQKYDIDKELTNTAAWSNGVIYKAGNRVYNDSNVLYYAQYPYAVFNLHGNYAKGDKVWWNDRTYECKQATTYISHAGAIQYNSVQSIPPVNVFPDNGLIGAQYWTDLGAYTIAAGTALSDATKWTQGDNRNQQLLMYLVDMVLYHVHSRIAPQNIPQLRQNRYDTALDWLVRSAKGEITADLPVLQPKQGARIRFGGHVKQINGY
ncbi:MAG: DUF1320 domain-containing protein [Sphingobacteriales bacterium]|nr:MAG: DUF1320 domain-containing protein [Sphingobacteriales bacterium]